jgi:transposase
VAVTLRSNSNVVFQCAYHVVWCPKCAPDNRESQAVFRCHACGRQDNADVNAAKNILAAGLAVTGHGDLAVGRSVKRQPPEAEVA